MNIFSYKNNLYVIEGLKSHVTTVPNPRSLPKVPKGSHCYQLISYPFNFYPLHLNSYSCKCVCGTVLSLKSISI